MGKGFYEPVINWETCVLSFIAEQVEKALAAQSVRASTLKSDFTFYDRWTFGAYEKESKKCAEQAASEAARLSLVKAAKSPTVPKPAKTLPDLSIHEPIVEIDDNYKVFEADSQGPGKYTIIHYRDWSEEYRVRTRVETSLSRPPLNEGTRESDMLTHRGARKITESCYYMAKCHGGFKTFVTGTFTEEVREKIAMGETTIQKEVSRTMDGMQKMFQRGWTTSVGERVPGNPESLAYCWVVEIPKNEQGEDNPHVHMMLGWRVPKKLFKDWAGRIEGIWGNGYFHLEKIKDPLCAGAYMAKAAGYMTKAKDQDDQGTVKGNRYGISKNARAPGWVTVHEAELGIMGQLISEINERCREKYDAIYMARNQLKAALEKCPKERKSTRIAIGKKLQRVRKTITELPVVSSKYQVILKTREAFARFLGFVTAQGWNAAHRPCSRWMGEFQERLDMWRGRRAKSRLRLTDEGWQSLIAEYSEDFIAEITGSNDVWVEC